MENIIWGSEEVMNIHLDPYGDLHADEYDFYVEFFTDSVCCALKIPKTKMTKIDHDNYEAVVDTSKVGRGIMKAVATCYIPDGRCENQLRTTKVDLTEKSIKIRIY